MNYKNSVSMYLTIQTKQPIALCSKGLSPIINKIEDKKHRPSCMLT